MKFRLSALGAILFISSVAQAADNGPYGVYGSLGTEGAGVGIQFMGRPSGNLRAEINSFNYNKDKTVDDINYRVDLKHISQSLLYDYRPYQGAFRLTTGVGINQSKLDFNGVSTNPLTPGSARGRIELPPVMPYFGIGLGLGKSNSGIGFYADLGAYVGSPKLKSFSLTKPTGSTLDEDTERRNLEDELKSLKVYPVGKVGISYQF
ncbi:MAG: hypothetical protein LW629_09090 [Burkholderiales bacterium]|nr:hypothetical protein [Burkholderiales bacterium]